MHFYTEFGKPFLLFNQQQCFIYSTASFLLKLRAKKVEKLHNSSFYRNLNTGTTISGFVDNNNNKKKLIPGFF
jgi:hypothetical protein